MLKFNIKKIPFMYNKLLIILLFLVSLFMSIGYASINSISYNIDGSAKADVQTGVFITDVVVNQEIEQNFENVEINTFYQTMLNSDIYLSKLDNTSILTLDITVYNSTEYDYDFIDVIYDNTYYSNSNIGYELNGISPGYVLGSKEYVTFQIKFYYIDGSLITGDDSNKLSSYLNFYFDRNPWKNISNYGFSSFDIINSRNEDYATINFTNVGGQYEKINLPLNNLEIGNLYQLTFTVSNDSGIITSDNAIKLVYGCTVMNNPLTDFTSSSKLIAFDGYNSGFLWKSLSSNEQTVTLSFWATAQTMYWIWDLSLLHDKNANLYIKDVSIEKSIKPSGAYVDLPNTSIYQMEYLKEGEESTLTKNKETFIIKGSYNDLHVKMQTAGGFEFINIPIVGLTSGKSYTVYFDNYTPANASSWKYGAKVQNKKQESGSQLVTDSDYLITDLSIVNSGSITFTATASTMYLVWDCGGISDYQWVDIYITNVSLANN